MNIPELVTGPWKLKDLRNGILGQPKHGMKVFSCFHCGGGSTMGYKLAGFDVLGGVEIDPKMMEIYRKNHEPKHSYLMGVKEFYALSDSSLPVELFNLDVLDGSPPCSSFSMAGSREKGWQEKKKFREGQTEQVLDDLFFDFIAIAKKLKPRMVIAENVKGLIQGNARGYVKKIFSDFHNAGYDTQLFLLNSSRMGVSQRRERTVFIAKRKDLKIKTINFEFNESPIPVIKAIENVEITLGKQLTPCITKWWPLVMIGDNFSKATGGNLFSWRKCDPNKPSSTITATHCLTHWDEKRLLSQSEVGRIQSFPDDFDYCNNFGPYVCGMSVPPLMMQRIASEVAKVLLNQDTRKI